MEKILKRVYESQRLTLCFKLISSACVVISVGAYCVLLFLSFYSSVPKGLAMLLSAAVPFFFVGFIRAQINAPRPYELYDFYEVKPKERAGRSFPSRHAYSIFVIAVLFAYYSIAASVALFVLGICLAVSRVFLGIHFVRDVVAGALLGAAAGALGIAIMLLNIT